MSKHEGNHAIDQTENQVTELTTYEEYKVEYHLELSLVLIFHEKFLFFSII